MPSEKTDKMPLNKRALNLRLLTRMGGFGSGIGGEAPVYFSTVPYIYPDYGKYSLRFKYLEQRRFSSVDFPDPEEEKSLIHYNLVDHPLEVSFEKHLFQGFGPVSDPKLLGEKSQPAKLSVCREKLEVAIVSIENLTRNISYSLGDLSKEKIMEQRGSWSDLVERCGSNFGVSISDNAVNLILDGSSSGLEDKLASEIVARKIVRSLSLQSREKEDIEKLLVDSEGKKLVSEYLGLYQKIEDGRTEFGDIQRFGEIQGSEIRTRIPELSWGAIMGTVNRLREGNEKWRTDYKQKLEDGKVYFLVDNETLFYYSDLGEGHRHRSRECEVGFKINLRPIIRRT